jgi:hypothetical protein
LDDKITAHGMEWIYSTHLRGEKSIQNFLLKPRKDRCENYIYKFADNIKMDLKETGVKVCESDSCGVECNSVAGRCEGDNDSSSFIKADSFLDK